MNPLTRGGFPSQQFVRYLGGEVTKRQRTIVPFCEDEYSVKVRYESDFWDIGFDRRLVGQCKVIAWATSDPYYHNHSIHYNIVLRVGDHQRPMYLYFTLGYGSSCSGPCHKRVTGGKWYVSANLEHLFRYAVEEKVLASMRFTRGFQKILGKSVSLPPVFELEN